MTRGLLAAWLLGLAAPVATAQQPPKPAPLKALFLGDKGHHRPADRAEQLIPVLATRGVDVTYTEDIDDLNAANLAKFDALIVYANIDAIPPGPEKALLDYVAGGGGFVPLHCASYCFRNSDAVVALVGAQFQRHGTGEFDTKIVDASHPIMKGLIPFRTWDETYVHTKHNTKERTVLQVRAEGDGEEPWTWVRTQGKGRVFYTAYGHDARTFGHPGFHDLVERGIRWASGKGEVFDGRPRVAENLPPIGDVPAPSKIPNYLPSTKWGVQGEPIARMAVPASPAESVKHMALPRGFRAELFASEPDIARPITMAWDHKGRLWIAESVDYPNEKRPPGQGRDRLKVCEDTDGDGRADTFTVFADGLSIPTSIAFAGGGVVIHQAPDTILLKDTDGDGKADSRTALLHGWGTDDTHAGPSNLRWGLDNWLWGIVGYASFNGTVGGETHSFRQGLYRFKPDGSKLEFLRSTNNNSWGLGFSEEGLVFGSTANGCPSVFLPVPNRFYEMVRGSTAAVLANIADSNRFFPVTEKVRQVDWHGGFTAGAGHALYTARAYPPEYWNKTAFVAEPTGHLVATFTLHPRGAEFASHNAWNLVASDDEWTSPILAEVGPDGNVWVIDWYNYIVQHNPTPQGFENGKGNAYVTPLRDKTHGRIYRIVHEDAKPAAPVVLDPADPMTLLSGLKSDNMFWRMHAQRLLVERGLADVAPQLVMLATAPGVDAIGLNPAAIHALHTLEGLRGKGAEAGPALVMAAMAALHHPSAGVRRNALAVLPRGADVAELILKGGLLSDPDPQVRLAALLALAEQAPGDAAGAAIAQALASGMADGDRAMADAAAAAAATNDRAFLKAIAGKSPRGVAAEVVASVSAKVAEHFARGPKDGKAPDDLIVALIDADERTGGAIIAGLSRGWPRDGKAELSPDGSAALARLVTKVPASSQGRLVALAAKWGTPALEEHAGAIATSLLNAASDAEKPEAARIEAARQLIEFRRADAEAAKSLLELVTPRTPPTLASGLVEAVGRSEALGAGVALVDASAGLTPAVRPVAIRALLGRSDWTSALLDGVEAGKARLSDLSLDQRASLAASKDKAVAARANRLLAAVGGGLPDADRQKVIDQMAPLVLKGGDPARGKLAFAQQCAKCHMHSGEGGRVGPELTGMASHPREEILVHVLDPSRSIEGNYTQYALATTDGRVMNGLLASESRTAVELVDAEGKKYAVLRGDIEDLAPQKKSLMPEGFEKPLGPGGLADLLAFLTARGKYLPLDLRKAANVVSTKGMFFDPESSTDRLVFPDWTPKSVDGVPFLLVDPDGDRVPNVIMLNGPHGKVAPTMPVAVSVAVNAPARTIHFLSGISGWGATGPDSRKSVSMIARLHYAGGATEDYPLRNGVEFADYIRPIDVPGSKLAFRLRDQQVRYFAIKPAKSDAIERIELVKGPDDTAPLVMAITVESGE